MDKAQCIVKIYTDSTVKSLKRIEMISTDKFSVESLAEELKNCKEFAFKTWYKGKPVLVLYY